MSTADMQTHVTSEHFGTLSDGTSVERWTLRAGGVRATVLTYGGIVQSVDAPDREGVVAPVALGFGDLASYVDHGESYFGALVGRYANRIAEARFTLDGREHRLPANDAPHCLHGGPRGFASQVWRAEEVAGGVELSRTSPDGEEGFPGNLEVRVRYTLTADGRLRFSYEAVTDAPTVVNLTNHSYVNLEGEGNGDVYGHRLRLVADQYSPLEAHGVSAGEPTDVAGTRFDFRSFRPVGADGEGFDHNFVLHGGVTSEPREVAELYAPGSGRVLRVATTEPGVQVYTAEHLDGTLKGTSGLPYGRGAGIALETQHFPDSPNRPTFPTTVLRPGHVYRSETVWAFSVQ
ncbi:aldose epimerase family protein [Streptomyces sp. NPDC059740]|uniref:aldose epimerase family protein n=1 Tax=Streptomyces sp. NPDC059740 TaxID=3346926 RepID=UPI0036462AEC